jgi:hypothetical protein
MSQPATSTTLPHQHSAARTHLPALDLLLLHEVNNPILSWQITKCKDRNVWESGGPSDPYRRQTNFSGEPRLCEPGRNPTSRPDIRLASGRSSLDWDTTDKETLSSRTKDHKIEFSRRRSDCYSHSLRRGENKTFYELTFTSLDDTSRGITLSGSEYPQLAEMFSNIAKRIN